MTTTDGAAVFSFGSSPKIHPADSSAPGAPTASDWVAPRHRGTPAEDRGIDGSESAYAVNMRTGAWFDTPPMQLVKNEGFTPLSI